MYELRIWNRWSYGHTTFRSDNLLDLKRKASNLIVDGDIQLVEVKEIKVDWLKNMKRYDPRKHELTNAQSKSLFHDACIYDKDLSSI